MLSNNFTYVILPVSEIDDENSTIDFSQLLNVSANTLRKNNDNSKAIVKYKGDQPSFLNGKTTYTHSQILSIVNDAEGEWYTETEIE